MNDLRALTAYQPAVMLLQQLEDAGHQALFVGGSVRDALLGYEIGDIDIATSALPDQVIELAEARGHRAIPTGLDHGTVTVVIEGIAHEVTTFRKDVLTDGRRAVVSFSSDIADDARRRDFTMNALYGDARGNVHDPIHGMADLVARRVKFIEDATRRISEDYLRILRFFRFHAWYGDPDVGLDSGALAAIAENLDGLEQLSAERVGSETVKLLSAPDPTPAVAAMTSCGALARILPGADARFLGPLVHAEDGRVPSAIRRLAVLGGDDPTQRLRLSSKMSSALTKLALHIERQTGVREIAYRDGAEMAVDTLLIRAAISGLELVDINEAGLQEDARRQCPVRAEHLMPAFSGKALGERLRAIEFAWIASDFELDKEQLLQI